MRLRDSFLPVLGLALCGVALPVWSQPVVGGDTAAREPAFVPGEVVVKLRQPATDPSAGDPATASTARERLEAIRSRFGAYHVRGLAGLRRGSFLSERARERLQRRAARRGRRASAAGAQRALQRAERRLAELSRVAVVEFPQDADVSALAARLSADPDIEYAHPNYIATAFFTPDDPYFSSCCSWGQTEDDLWGLKLLELEAAWGSDPTDFQNAGEGVIVAVVDTGLDVAHPDIAQNVWVNLGHGASPPEIPNNGIDDDGNGYIDDVNGFDFTRSVDVNADGDFDDPEDVIFPDPIDENGHGTHVSGTIAAVGNNASGVVGVAPKVQIMPVRGLGADGSGSTVGLASALVYAATNGADVINNSWGCAYCPAIGVIEDAVRLAHDLDVVVVFAAGNESDNAVVRSPQNMSETITVSAATPTDELTTFSSFGPLVDVGAPGGSNTAQPYNVLSLNVVSLQSELATTHPELVVGGSYLRLAGTSMATPHVSGVAALLRGFDPTLDNEQVRQILRLASDPIYPLLGGYPGHGRVNARKALQSTLSAEVFIDTPDVELRTAEGTIQLSGVARGPNLQNVQVSAGWGPDPAAFIPLPTTRDPLTGAVSATFDSSQLPGGFALLRLQADDGVQTYESTTSLSIADDVAFLEPVAGSTVSGQIDVVLDIGSVPSLQRVVIAYPNELTGTTEILLDQTSFPTSQLTTTLDTLASIDTDQLQGLTATLLANLTYLVAGQSVTITKTVGFQIDNDRIDSPALGTRLSTTDPFQLSGTALHDVELQARIGGSWTPVGTIPPGGFSILVNPTSLGLNPDLDNLLPLRLLADIDGDGQYEETEQNALTAVVIDPALAPAWPQSIHEGVLYLGVSVGDVDGDGYDEAVLTPNGNPFCNFPGGDCSFTDPTRFYDPVAKIHVFEGDGSLNAAVVSGSSVFQEPKCSHQATLLDLDDAPGLEMIWASWGQIAALRHDGQAPVGFDPDVFNNATFLPEDLDAHTDPNYIQLDPCRPAGAFRTSTGQRSIIQQSQRFDVTLSLGGLTPYWNLIDNRVLAFDRTGSLVNEVSQGASGNRQLNWAIADVDADGSLEIVTDRREILRPGESSSTSILVYDALSLALESEFFVDGFSGVDDLLVGDIDGDQEMEIVFAAASNVGNQKSILAFHADGVPLAGSPFPVGIAGSTRALADLDQDGDVEVLAVTGLGDVQLRALDYDGVSFQDLPGWPVTIRPAPKTLTPGTILVGDVDDDPQPEVIYSSSEAFNYTVGTRTFLVAALEFVSVVNADGSPWHGGWSRTAPGLSSMALGNLDAGPEPDLVLATRDLFQNDPSLPGFYDGKVLAFPLEGVFAASGMQWTHYNGNAQQTGTVLPDADHDGIPDQGDNCAFTPNAPPLDCDTDMDGYGNACDCDYNNNFTCTDDFNEFRNEYNAGGGGEADANCNGTVTDDFAAFRNGYNNAPGTLESGLACAGTVPCP